MFLRVLAAFAAIVAVSYFLPYAEASVCPQFFALIGPCVSFMCPNNATCICGCCCQSVLTTTTTRNRNRNLRRGAARTGSGSACRDRLPDCMEKRHLCNNPQFDQLMTEKCPRTCNRCPKVSKLPGRDKTEKFEEPEDDYEDPKTSIAEWYGNNQGGFGGFGNGFGYTGNGAYSSGSGFGSGYGSSNYGNYYG